MGIEPTSSAWKAEVLAFELHPQLIQQQLIQLKTFQSSKLSPRNLTHPIFMVEGGGFEPPKAEPADLQSAPFDRSGTPPRKSSHKRSIFAYNPVYVNSRKIEKPRKFIRFQSINHI